jgi:hypothetical protein
MGIGAYVRDVTLDSPDERRRGRAAHRFMILTTCSPAASRTRRNSWTTCCARPELTESAYVNIYLYDEERREFTLSSLSWEAAQGIRVPDAKTVCPLEDSTFWAGDPAAKALVVNDFEKPNPLKKGLRRPLPPGASCGSPSSSKGPSCDAGPGEQPASTTIRHPRLTVFMTGLDHAPADEYQER